MTLNKILTTSAISGLIALGTAHAAPNLSFEQKDITQVGWSVDYLGCTYDAVTETSTYAWEMTTDSSEKDLSHWVLGFDEDMLIVDSSGGNTTEFGLDPTTGVYGFKWDDGQLAGTVQTYSLTLNGECNEATTSYAVKGGTYYAIGETTGPTWADDPVSNTTYSISGTVYIDANNNQTQDLDEPAISNTTVQLLDASGNVIASAFSDGNGDYTFSGLVAGDYTIYVPEGTPNEEGDFNEDLTDYFNTPYTSTPVSIVDTDVSEIDFGYSPDLGSVMDDIDTSDPDADGYSFAGTGKTIGYWKHQHSVAIKGKGRAHVDSATLSDYLVTIESQWLANPFNFGADKFGNSFAILSAKTSDATELLNKQLLGTELNHVDGRGMSNAMELQGALLSYAEFVSAYNGQFTRDEILAVKDLMDTINNSGE